MERKKAVADASVVTKWYLEEPWSANARNLRDTFVTGRIDLSVPALLFYESLNALRYTGLYEPEELVTISRSLSGYGFQIHGPSGPAMELAYELALESDLSIYDSVYIALARHLGTDLYTADQEMVSKMPDTAIHIKDIYPSGDGLRDI